MRAFALYGLKRLGQFVLVVFIGINIAYVITHATPIDPVEQSIAAVTAYGNTSPEAIAMMRTTLREIYGLTGTPLEQYLHFWRHVATADFGPVAVGLPDAGDDADRPRAAVDHRPDADRDLARLGARQRCSAAWPATTATPRPQDDGHGGDGAAPDPVLHRRLRAAGGVRLPVAGAADQPAAAR